MKVGVNVITVVFFAAVPANSEALFFSFEVGAELNCDCHPLMGQLGRHHWRRRTTGRLWRTVKGEVKSFEYLGKFPAVTWMLGCCLMPTI